MCLKREFYDAKGFCHWSTGQENVTHPATDICNNPDHPKMIYVIESLFIH